MAGSLRTSVAEPFGAAVVECLRSAVAVRSWSPVSAPLRSSFARSSETGRLRSVSGLSPSVPAGPSIAELVGRPSLWPGGPVEFGSASWWRSTSLVVCALRSRVLMRRGWTWFSLVEPRSWVLVLSAGAPLRAAPIALLGRIGTRPLCLLGAVPQPAALEPAHHDVRVGATELLERRQQLFLLLRTKGSRLVVDQNRPVGEAGRHEPIVLRRYDDENRRDRRTRRVEIRKINPECRSPAYSAVSAVSY